tara:strand:+ start:5418 stop:6446 length:1029 start_codon:yes stop_codon:yes gene_type:complete
MRHLTIIPFIIKPTIIGLCCGLVFLLFQSSALSNIKQYLHISNQTSFADAVEKAAPAVVNIYNINNSTLKGMKQGLGSGVIVSDQGFILTNYHVIRHASQILIALQDGREFYSSVIGFDEMTDLAVLKIAADDLPVIPLDLEVQTRVGDFALAIGNPYDIGQTITQGVISATGRVSLSSSKQQLFLQTDAAINQGNSGGALINDQGFLIGINTAVYKRAESINLAIPVKLAHKIMMQLIKYGHVTRSTLGIQGGEIGLQKAEELHIKNSHAFMIVEIKPESPAFEAGLRIYDVITHINERDVTSATMLKDEIVEMRPGTQVILTVERKGEVQKLPVYLKELK